MSERSERIVASLDDQWRTTREIADRAGVEEYVRLSPIYHTLNQAVKYRLAEKRMAVGGRTGRTAEWRRIQ